jgi:exosome complex component CSL4
MTKKIEINKSFRCGDIVIARVISLGDTNSYFLSVAENELGVVIAYSEAGHKMVPISWNEMQCPITLLKEHRKVAKIQPEFINYVEPTEEDTKMDQTVNGK